MMKDEDRSQILQAPFVTYVIGVFIKCLKKGLLKGWAEQGLRHRLKVR